jgi:REP element-mobilizing transposase RayT
MQLLSKNRTRLWFIEALDKARAKHEFDLWAWVIMPEHVHLLIYPRKPLHKTAKILASIKKPVGYRAIQFLKENDPAFLQQLTVVNKNRTYHHFWQVGPGYDKTLTTLRLFTGSSSTFTTTPSAVGWLQLQPTGCGRAHEIGPDSVIPISPWITLCRHGIR